VINVLIQGDGRRTGICRHHFLITVAVLNAGELVLSPMHHYALLLSAGRGSYTELDRLLPSLRAEIEDLRQSALRVSDTTRNVELHLSADWKLLNFVMGLSGATATMFCPCCLLMRDERTGASNRRDTIITRESVCTLIGLLMEDLQTLIYLDKTVLDSLEKVSLAPCVLTYNRSGIS